MKGRDRRRCCSAPPGSAAGSTSCATCSPGAQGQRRDGRRRDPHDLRPARRRARPRAARRHRRHARPPVPQGRADAAATPTTTCWPSPASRSAHWKKIWSTNPLERLNKEVKRRTDVVGVFPNPDALLRLAGAVLVEAHDEWQVSDRRYLSRKAPWPPSPRPQGGDASPAHAGIDPPTSTGTAPRAYHAAEPHRGALARLMHRRGRDLGGCRPSPPAAAIRACPGCYSGWQGGRYAAVTTVGCVPQGRLTGQTGQCQR